MIIMRTAHAGARGAHDARRDGVHAAAAVHGRHAGRDRRGGELAVRGRERPGACAVTKVRKVMQNPEYVYIVVENFCCTLMLSCINVKFNFTFFTFVVFNPLKIELVIKFINFS